MGMRSMIYVGVQTASPHRDGGPSAANKARTRTVRGAQALDRMAATTIFRFCMDIDSREHRRSPDRARTAISRLGGYVSPEASIREYMACNALFEFPVQGSYSENECRRCRRR